MTPTPCPDAYAAALEYLGRKTMPWPPARRTALRHSSLWMGEDEARIQAAIARQDLAATQAACKAWWSAVLAFQGAEENA